MTFGCGYAAIHSTAPFIFYSSYDEFIGKRNIQNIKINIKGKNEDAV